MPDPTVPNKKPRPYRLIVSPEWLCGRLAWGVVALAVVGTLANVLIHQVLPSPDGDIAKVLRRFDIGHEPSIVQLWSSFSLLAAALLMSVIAATKRAAEPALAVRWLVLSGLFVLLAIDEAVMFHEMVDTALHRWWGTTGALYFPWVIPGGLFALLVGCLSIRFLTLLHRGTRYGLIISGLVFVGGAVGVEMVSGAVIESMCTELPNGQIASAHPYGLLAFTICQAVEESMEMLGVVLLIYVLLKELERGTGRLEFQLGPAASTAGVSP